MKNILYSIVVPVYKVERYLQECIDSLRAQTYQNIEIILIDDGSPDKSGEICDKNSLLDERVKVIHKENGGVSSARYEGVKSSQGEYVLCVDSDDWISNNCVERINDVIISNGSPDIVIYGHFRMSKDGMTERTPLIPAGYYTYSKKQEFIYPNLIQDENSRYFSPAIWGKVFKRELLLDNMISSKSAIIGEDMACSVPAIYHGKSLFIMHECFYYYRYNDSSITKSKKVFQWNCAKTLAEHLDSKMNLSDFDFQMQVYRYVVHMLFITAVSQWNSKENRGKIRETINLNLKDDFYKRALTKCKFKCFSKGWVAQLVLKYRLYSFLKLYHKFH